MATALHVPGHVWVKGLLMAAPDKDHDAHMEWLRTLAALSASCTFFRRLLLDPVAAELYRIAVVCHPDWRGGKPAGHAVCTGIVRWLSDNRAQQIQHLRLDCSAISHTQLLGFLAGLTSLRLLHADDLSRAASIVLAQSFETCLLSLRALALTQLLYMPEALPAGLILLQLSLGVQMLNASERPRLRRSLQGLSQLQIRELTVSGAAPHSLVAQLLFCLVWDICQAEWLPALRTLTIRQEFEPGNWPQFCATHRTDVNDPLGFML